MADQHPVFIKARKACQELNNFDWRQLLNPATVGRWPVLARLLLLLLCALLIVRLMFTLSNMLAPPVSDDEYDVVTALEQNISAQHEQNIFANTQKRELNQRGFYWYALLQQEPVEVTDITQTMDVVRAAADASGLQLLSVAPELVADKGVAVMTVKARLTLSSLSLFWFLLSEAPVHFSITAIDLRHTQKPDIFELDMGVVVRVAADVGAPTPRLSQAAFADDLPQPASGNSDAQNKASQKGFLTRSGSNQFLYLIRDEKGRLTRVEK